MRVFETVTAFLEWRRSQSAQRTLGFVPTMGALHDGHQSLLERAARENDLVVLSVFVNPTQFNQASDFENYPKTREQDLERARQAGVDALFAPKDRSELYPDRYRYRVTEKEFSEELCGAHRPGHFEGVLTVVLKLFQIVKADRAYFGEKDGQQLELVRGLTEAFFLDTEIVACPTVREADGLAMSSRNLRLSSEERKRAPKLFETLRAKNALPEARATLEGLGFKVEYLEDRGARRYVAAWLGDVRLIDNLIRPSDEGAHP